MRRTWIALLGSLAALSIKRHQSQIQYPSRLELTIEPFLAIGLDSLPGQRHGRRLFKRFAKNFGPGTQLKPSGNDKSILGTKPYTWGLVGLELV